MNIFENVVNEITRINSLEIRSIDGKIVKFNEEFGEFCAEIIKAEGLTPKPYNREHLIEEAADSLQMLISIQLDVCKKMDIKFDEVLDAILVKNVKWENNIKKYTVNEKKHDFIN